MSAISTDAVLDVLAATTRDDKRSALIALAATVDVPVVDTPDGPAHDFGPVIVAPLAVAEAAIAVASALTGASRAAVIAVVRERIGNSVDVLFRG